MQISFSRIVIVGVFCTTLFACANKSLAPVEERKIGGADNNASVSVDGVIVDGKQASTSRNATSLTKTKTANQGFHVVKAGDTLHGIAFRYQSDFKQIAEWNNISDPYTIYVGQVLRLKPQTINKQATKPDVKPVAKPAPVKTAPKPKIPATPPKPKTKVAKKDEVFHKGPVSWQWPAQGNLVKSNSPSLKKGVNISGKVGQQIKAAANGKVVYSGSGLLGYGKLIIIKHSETYLSAYAYNSKLLVKEGDVVKLGQNISLMGQDNNDRAILHFEIRKNGKPVNPLDFLPKKRG